MSQLQADEMFEEQPPLVVERPVERPAQDGISYTEIEEQHLRMRLARSDPRHAAIRKEERLDNLEAGKARSTPGGHSTALPCKAMEVLA